MQQRLKGYLQTEIPIESRKHLVGLPTASTPGEHSMKHFRLSPFTRQLIIFLLLVALLWQGRPVVGPDGLVAVRLEYYSPLYMHGWRPVEGIKVTIHASDSASTDYTAAFEVREALLVSYSNIVRPEWAIKAVSYAPWLTNVLPKRFTAQDGLCLDIILRIKPSEWECVEEAKRKGWHFYFSGGVRIY